MLCGKILASFQTFGRLVAVVAARWKWRLFPLNLGTKANAKNKGTRIFFTQHLRLDCDNGDWEKLNAWLDQREK